MKTYKLRGRLSIAVVGASVVALAALVGIAYAAEPVVRALPSIAGKAEDGQVLTVRNGQWGGTQPITYSYQWRSCGAGGGNCADVQSATNRTFTLAANDVGKTMRVRVTARNADGSASAVSRPSAVVKVKNAPPPGPDGQIKLADGKTSIPVTSVAPPERLIVSEIAFAPNPVRSRTPFTGTFRVADTRGFVVRGALVYAIGLPYGRVLPAAEQTTSTEGYATIQLTPTTLLPLRNGAYLVFFVRARKSGDNVLAGVSSRRLVQLRLASP